MDMKQCTKCKEYLPRTEEYFYARNDSTNENFRAACRKCTAVLGKQWCDDNKDSKNEYNRQLYQHTRDKVLERQRKYYRRNKDRVRVRTRNRKIKKLTMGTYTNQDIRDLLIQQENYCYYCGSTLDKYHVDHKIPLSRDGSNWPDNLCITCPKCNDQKGTRTPEQWKECYL